MSAMYVNKLSPRIGNIITQEGALLKPQMVITSWGNMSSDITDNYVTMSKLVFERGDLDTKILKTNISGQGSRFTVQVAGVYLVTWDSYRYDDSADSSQNIYLNGVYCYEKRFKSTGAVGWGSMTSCFYVQMNIGDYIECYARGRLHHNNDVGVYGLSRFTMKLEG